MFGENPMRPSRDLVRVRSLSLWRGAHFYIARAITYGHLVRVGSLSLWRGAIFDSRNLLGIVAHCQFWHRSRNSLVTLCVAVLISADSLCLEKGSYEFSGRPLILQEFHGAVLGVHEL